MSKKRLEVPGLGAFERHGATWMRVKGDSLVRPQEQMQAVLDALYAAQSDGEPAPEDGLQDIIGRIHELSEQAETVREERILQGIATDLTLYASRPAPAPAGGEGERLGDLREEVDNLLAAAFSIIGDRPRDSHAGVYLEGWRFWKLRDALNATPPTPGLREALERFHDLEPKHLLRAGCRGYSTSKPLDDVNALRTLTTEPPPQPESGLREALEDRHNRMKEALSELGDQYFDGRDVDGGDFEEILSRHGVLVKVPATEDFKRLWDADEMYVFEWSEFAPARTLTRTGEE